MLAFMVEHKMMVYEQLLCGLWLVDDGDTQLNLYHISVGLKHQVIL